MKREFTLHSGPAFYYSVDLRMGYKRIKYGKIETKYIRSCIDIFNRLTLQQAEVSRIPHQYSSVGVATG